MIESVSLSEKTVSLNIENRITAKTKKQARSVKRYAFHAAITSAMANELNDSDFQIFNKRV